MRCFDRLFQTAIKNQFPSRICGFYMGCYAIQLISNMLFKNAIHFGATIMARIFARILGLIFLLQGFAIGLIDGTRSIAASQLDWTSFGAALNWLMPERMAAAAANPATGGVMAWAWDYGILPLLPAPAIALFFGIGVFLLILVRDRKAII
jgi:hypothetical protein